MNTPVKSFNQNAGLRGRPVGAAIVRGLRVLALGGVLAGFPGGGLAPLSGAPERFDVFDVFIGYDGIVPEGAWFPVVCEIENKGPSFSAFFELGTRYDDHACGTPVELPTGTLKRFVLPVFAAGQSYGEFEARLLDERGRLRAEGLVRPVRRQQAWLLPMVGALSRTVAGRPVFPVTTNQNRGTVQVEAARLLPELFPDNPIALEGLATVYLNSAQATEDRLRVNQVTALLAWLNAGGHLIVGVEQLAQINGAPWLRQILPCNFERTSTLTNHAALQEWLASRQRLDGGQYDFGVAPPPGSSRSRPNPPVVGDPFSSLRPAAGFESEPLTIATGQLLDGRIVMGTATEPLVITSRRGRGRLTVLTFSPELEPFLSWAHREFFWAKLADVPPAFLPPNTAPNQRANYSADGVFGALIDSRQVRKLPVEWLLILLVGYLVVIGPLDRWWLKKINRQMLTWITFPAYVVCFSLLIYYIGYKLRGGVSEWNELHVVDVLPHRAEAQLHGHTYASVYAPANARYKLACDLPYAALRGELLRQGRGSQEAGQAKLVQRGNNFTGEIFVPVWTSQLYVNNWWDRRPVPLAARVQRQGGGYEVRLDNHLDQAVTAVRLMVDGQVFELGTVPAGASRTVKAERHSTMLAAFVRDHGLQFRNAVNRRGRAFGEGLMDFPDHVASSMAACFLSVLDEPAQPYNSFLSPPGLDLSPWIEQGDAVLLAWSTDHAPVPPIHQFTPQRSARHTLWRLTCPVDADGGEGPIGNDQ